MTTNKRRGRDPEQHEIIVDLPAAARHVGLPGELTAVSDPDSGAIISLRFHDGVSAGGSPVPVGGPGAGATPPATILPPTDFSETAPPEAGVLIVHNLGYWPLIGYLDAAREVIAAPAGTVASHDEEGNSLHILLPVTFRGYIILR